MRGNSSCSLNLVNKSLVVFQKIHEGLLLKAVSTNCLVTIHFSSRTKDEKSKFKSKCHVDFVELSKVSTKHCCTCIILYIVSYYLNLDETFA